MRVTMKYNGSPASCETFAYGEVEDYTVNVVEPSITYCNSKGKNSNYEWIEKIRIGNFRESSGKNGGYADLTSRIIPISIGGPIPVTLTPGFSGTLYDEYWKIWIDLNVDGDFDDAGELVFDAGTLSKSIVTGNIVLPITVVPVETRLRISMKYNGAQTSCEVYSYGEVEDYTVNIGGVGKQATAIIEDIGDDEHFVIYPNPGKYDFVTVDLNWLRSNHELQLKVFDLTGKLVRIDFLNSGKLKYFLPISNLNNGIYKVVVTDGLTHKSLKLAVIR
ncbi:MAG: T9SS type A sorting domain-containing protein [Bacteroidia bacterium]|nr:T9SS type A sorting domain-containing protein [Bacteroidia bacterium]